MTRQYDDIINLPHHVSPTRQQMSFMNRAAQFAPFAALTGHDAAVKETARLTDEKIELGEGAIADLDLKLSILADKIDDHPKLSVIYFQPDEKKDGGAYVKAIGSVKKIDDYERAIVFMTGEIIKIEDIFDIECELFRDLG